MLKFIILAYTLGPMATISYGFYVLAMTPLQIFLALSLLNILPIPFLFKLFEFGGRHRKLYRLKLFKKAAALTDEKLEDIMAEGDRITRMFEARVGHLGFYAAIAVITFIFGIVWASLLSYVLMVKRKKAMLYISIGVVAGNLFWLILTRYSLNYITPVGIIALAAAIPLLAYGSKREMEVLKKVAHRIMEEKKKAKPSLPSS